MDLLQIGEQINTGVQAGMIGLLIVLAGMIRIPKLELNFWNWLGRFIGRSLNGEVIERVEKLDKELSGLKHEIEQVQREEELERVRMARQRILRFSDEILYGKHHSKEHFDEILDDITLYEHYCNEHEDYENNKAVLAIKTIREVYQDCLKHHDFLTYEKKAS